MKKSIFFAAVLCASSIVFAQKDEKEEFATTSTPFWSTTEFYNPAVANEKGLMEYIASLMPAPKPEPVIPPLEIRNQLYATYCRSRLEKSHIYIVEPDTDCQRFFQSTPTHPRTRSQRCSYGTRFNVEKCTCTSSYGWECTDEPVYRSDNSTVNAITPEEYLDLLRHEDKVDARSAHVFDEDLEN